MLDRLVLAIEHKQPRLVAPSQRLLRNQFFWQFVVEFGKPHVISEEISGYQPGRANAACGESNLLLWQNLEVRGFDCGYGGCGARLDAEAFQDVLDVLRHGSRTYSENSSNLAVGFSDRDVCQNF